MCLLLCKCLLYLYCICTAASTAYTVLALQECLRVHDVVVVTAQIVVNSLQQASAGSRIDITDIDLLIMDECHHANLDHPYNNIMR